MKIPIYMQGQDDNLYQDELNQALQGALSDNGWGLPNQTTANIAEIAPSKPKGVMWYDTDTNEFKVTINGVIHIVQTVPA